MISTFFLLLLLAFWLWYLAADPAKAPAAGYQAYVLNNPRTARLAGSGLALLTAALFVARFGPMTGLCAWLVGLMGVGCLVVVLAPFRYLSPAAVGALYACLLTLEIVL